MRVLVGGFLGVVWLLPLVLLVCLSFSVFMCLANNMAKVEQLRGIGFRVFVCYTFQESINVCCQVLEEFLGELRGYKNT